MRSFRKVKVLQEQVTTSGNGANITYSDNIIDGRQDSTTQIKIIINTSDIIPTGVKIEIFTTHNIIGLITHVEEIITSEINNETLIKVFDIDDSFLYDNISYKITLPTTASGYSLSIMAVANTSYDHELSGNSEFFLCRRY